MKKINDLLSNYEANLHEIDRLTKERTALVDGADL